MKRISFLFFVLVALFGCKNKQSSISEVTSCTNPVIYADIPDISITRAGDEFYMISTTMHLMPGAPIMKSKDMVHWEIINYVFDKLEDTPKYNLENGTVYGRGQWASSIRYHNGKFYVLFSPNDQPYQGYIYSTTDPAGEWKLVSRIPHFHDASLFFDDDGKVYVFYGTGDLIELKEDLSGVKPNGVNQKIFERDADEQGLLEGSQVVKHDGKYYLLMISMDWSIPGRLRRQVCYRADNITGPYEKKVILENEFEGFGGVGQGCIIDDENGNWYGMIFQDRGGIGRIPILYPCTWIDGWPMLGDSVGNTPKHWDVPLKTYDTGRRVVESDDFEDSELKLNWQWNHNPLDESWSLTERPGHLRLKTNIIVDNLFSARNTISQRMEGPICSGIISIDLSNMKDGDVAGFSAFNGHSGLLSVVKDRDKKYLTMSTNTINMDAEKRITHVDVDEKARIEISTNQIFLRIDCDFNLQKDIATFSYSFDRQEWIRIGDEFKMRFDYLRLFMGTRFAIFNYATKEKGGYVDIDFFEFEKKN